jgi:glycerol kinase
VERFILALDQGTTSSRAVLLDSSGRIAAVAQREFSQHFPQSGWVEHDPEEIWSSQLAVARSVLRKAKVTPGQVVAIGISNQRETTLLWDRRTGHCVHRAIVWQDRRTSPTCQRLQRSSKAELFTDRTGLIIDPYFAGTKLAWLLDHVPEARALARAGHLAFGTVDSWLLWKLTGGTASSGARHRTDLTNASRTLLCNIREGIWDPELTKALRIPSSVLPEIMSSDAHFGETQPKLLGASIPIMAMAGDQHAALFGQLCTQPGMVKNTYGTGCFMLMHTGKSPKASRNKLLTTPAWQLGSKIEYALEGSIFVAGAVVQWLRDGLGIIKRSADIEPLARQVPDNGGVYLVPAFAGLGTPHWDPWARGAMVGLTRGTRSAHIARAALESIAFQTADVLDAMQSDAKLPVSALRVDGGAAVNDLLMQFQADLLGVSVVRPKNFEATALGAGFMAGLSAGVWRDREELNGCWEIDRVFEPQAEPRQIADLRGNWQRAVERSLGWER